MKTSVLAKGETKRGVALVVVFGGLIGGGLIVLNLMPAELPGAKIPAGPASAPTSASIAPPTVSPAGSPASSPADPPSRLQPASEPPKPLRTGMQTFGS